MMVAHMQVTFLLSAQLPTWIVLQQFGMRGPEQAGHTPLQPEVVYFKL